MTDHANERGDGTNEEWTAGTEDPVASVEAYREEDTVVLYDAQNPLAWVETTAAVSLADRT